MDYIMDYIYYLPLVLVTMFALGVMVWVFLDRRGSRNHSRHH